MNTSLSIAQQTNPVRVKARLSEFLILVFHIVTPMKKYPNILCQVS